MRKVILFLLLISYFNNANADFNKLTQNGISSIFLKSCSELLDLYEKAEKVDSDLITNISLVRSDDKFVKLQFLQNTDS